MVDSSSSSGSDGHSEPKAATDSSLAPGSLFANRYKIIGILGHGGMGEVYLAHDQLLGTGEPVALKLLRPELSSDERQLKRFLREVQLTRKVHHENVIRTFDVSQFDEKLYFTMEYIEGISLKERIGGEPIPPDEAVRIIAEIANGLAAIHDAGIVHRDLKPANVILLPDGRLKIADFGVACSGWSTLTQAHEVIGSAPYMAPELWVGRDVGPAADLYALGIVFYEVLTGIIPFDGDSAAEMMCKHLDATPPLPSEIANEVATWVDDVVLSLLRKSPSDRPASAHHFLELLGPELVNDTIVETISFSASRPASTRVTLTEEELLLLSPAQDDRCAPPTYVKPILPTVFNEFDSLQTVELPPQTAAPEGVKYVHVADWIALFCLSAGLIALGEIAGPMLWSLAKQSSDFSVPFTFLGTLLGLTTTGIPVLILSGMIDGFRRAILKCGRAVGTMLWLSVFVAFLNVLSLGIAPYRVITSFSSEGVREVVEMTTTNIIEIALLHPVSTGFYLQKDNGTAKIVRSRRPGIMRLGVHWLFCLLFTSSILSIVCGSRISARSRWTSTLLVTLPMIGYFFSGLGDGAPIKIPVGPVLVSSSASAIITAVLSWMVIAVVCWHLQGVAERE